MAELYDPAIFSAAVLAANKTEWVADVKDAYMDLVDFASRAKANPESTPVDRAEIDNVLGSVKVDYAKFLADFSTKCIITPDTSASDSSVNGNAIAVQNAEKTKAAEIEVKIIKEKIDQAVSQLDAEVKQVPDWSVAKDHVIQLAMSSVTPWKNQLKELHNQMWEMRRKVECRDLDTDTLGECGAKVDTITTEVERAITVIKREDDARCLYSLVRSKTADVEYPMFSGTFGEDYKKFEDEMQRSFIMNRVRRDNKVSVLRSKLSGSALKVIPKTMTNIDDAFNALSKLYGSASQVINHRKKQLLALGQFPDMDDVKTASFIRSQVEWLLSAETYFQDMFELATKSDKLNREVYNSDTFKDLVILFPLKIISQMSSAEDISIQAQFEALVSVMKTKKDELQFVLKNLPHDEKISKSRKGNNFSSVRPPEWDEMDEVERDYYELVNGYETDESDSEDEVDREYRILMHGYEE